RAVSSAGSRRAPYHGGRMRGTSMRTCCPPSSARWGSTMLALGLYYARAPGEENDVNDANDAQPRDVQEAEAAAEAHPLLSSGVDQARRNQILMQLELAAGRGRRRAVAARHTRIHMLALLLTRPLARPRHRLGKVLIQVLEAIMAQGPQALRHVPDVG